MSNRFAASCPLSRRRFLGGVAGAAFLLRGTAGSVAETAPDGTQVLRARERTASATEALRPALWGYDGVVPGPTLRVKRGEELRVRLINELAQPTSIHWHGIRVPNAMDGVPGLTQAVVVPGASFDYRFRPPDAGTFWYHAPGGGPTDRGLHGALIVDDDTRPTGVDRELLLVFGAPPPAGETPVLVNGTVRPDFMVKPGERLRVRLINATAAQGLVLRVEEHQAWLVAVDGQPSEAFLAREGRVALGPGSRIDLIIDALRPAGTIAPILADDGVPVARLVYQAGELPAARAARLEPPALPANPLPTRIDLRTALRLDFDLGSRRPFDPKGPPLLTAKRGRAVALTLRNASGTPQVFHLHGHSFRHLDRLDDGWKPFWLDTFVIGNESERIAFLADNPGKWLIECRALGRPDDVGEAYFVVN